MKGMAAIKIIASLKEKGERQKNVIEIIEILNHVYAEEKLLTSFKEKFQDWTHKIGKEWRLSYFEKLDALRKSKLLRILSTAVILICCLESFGCYVTQITPTLYFTLGFVYCLLLVSVVWITHNCSTYRFFDEIYNYFEFINLMSELLTDRMNCAQSKMDLHKNWKNRLQLGLNDFQEKPGMNLSSLLVSYFSLYGIFVAFAVFGFFSFFQYESLTILTYFNIFLISYIIISKVFTISDFTRKTESRKQRMQYLTEDFISWFKNGCELNCILHAVKSPVIRSFSNPSSKHLCVYEYISLLIFAVTIEDIFRSNLGNLDLQKAVYILLYGQLDNVYDESPRKETSS